MSKLLEGAKVVGVVALCVLGGPLALLATSRCTRPSGQVPIAAAPRAAPAIIQGAVQAHEAQARNTQETTERLHTIERTTDHYVTRIERAPAGDAGRLERHRAFRDGVRASVQAGGYAMDSVPGGPEPTDAPDVPRSP